MKNGELPDVIEPNGGPYIIVTAMTEDSVTFKYGWSNVNFFGELRPVQVWIGLYNETDSHYAYVGPAEKGGFCFSRSFTQPLAPSATIFLPISRLPACAK